MPHDGARWLVDGEQGLILEPERTQVCDSLPGSKQLDYALAKGVGLGMDARYGLLWCRVPHVDFMPAYYILAGATPGPDGVTLSSWRWVFTEADHDAERYFGKDPEDPGFGPNGYTTVPNILSVGDTEALRLAVLAVAGVEG